MPESEQKLEQASDLWRARRRARDTNELDTSELDKCNQQQGKSCRISRRRARPVARLLKFVLDNSPSPMDN